MFLGRTQENIAVPVKGLNLEETDILTFTTMGSMWDMPTKYV